MKGFLLGFFISEISNTLSLFFPGTEKYSAFSDLYPRDITFCSYFIIPKSNNMKAFLTLVLILLFGAAALAQKTTHYGKVETLQMDIVLDSSLPVSHNSGQIKATKEDAVARLYKFKNTRVKRALAFSTKKNNPKLA